MSRIDLILFKRISSRIALTIVVFFGLIMLVESIDSWRYQYLASVGGLPLAALGMVMAAFGWLLQGLPLLVLVGTVIGVVDLQSRRELSAIKASGASVWRIVRAPALAVLVFGLFVTLYGDGVVTSTNRQLDASIPGADTSMSANGFWLEQTDGQRNYVISADHVVADGRQLTGFVAFLPDGLNDGRITAPVATLAGGAWVLPKAVRYRAGGRAEQLGNFRLPTTTTAADLKLKLGSASEMTFYELASALFSNISDPALRAAVLTNFLRLSSLPLLLVGSLFIAFAFTTGYRRTSGYGQAILYAILTGFVVFAITEMADRAGSAGILDPTFAACGPSFVAIVIGLTVLLYREDGWA